MKYDPDHGKKLFETSNFDERIARFMELKKEKGYWQHPCEFAVSDTLGFKRDWQWLMPVVEKIQLNYCFDVVLKEFGDRFDGSFNSSIMIFGHSWVHYHWSNYDRIKAEIDEQTRKAARYGEKYVSEHHQFVENKFQAVYLCVCRFIEWWEKQNL